MAAVGRLVDSSQADDRRMIRLVRERQLLYVRTNLPVACYYAKVKQLWKEVADEMGWTVADVRRKWSHVRNSYSRHLRNETQGAVTGRGRAVSRWYLADELAFLRDHMATDTRPSPYSSYPPTLVGLGALGEGDDEKPFVSPWLSFAASGDPTPSPAPCPSPAPSPAPAGSDSDSSLTDDGSAYFQFFRGLHPEWCRLDVARRRRFQRDCLAALHALLEQQESPPPAPAPPAPAPPPEPPPAPAPPGSPRQDAEEQDSREKFLKVTNLRSVKQEPSD